MIKLQTRGDGGHVVGDCCLYFSGFNTRSIRWRRRGCRATRTAAPTPRPPRPQTPPPAPPRLRCSASLSNARRFASAVANLKRMSLLVFWSTSAASWRSRRRRLRTTRPSGSQFSLLKGLPRPMVGFGGFSFFSLGLRTTNKKRKGNYANRHEHGLRCGRITSLCKSFRRHA
jgi:hypothetical protein